MASDHHVTGVPNMTMDEFRKSLIAAQPPAELTPALVGLWWDAKADCTRAHESDQQDEGPEGSWVHAYLHRKGGDQGNAAYWYGRAGKPVCREPLDAEWLGIVRGCRRLGISVHDYFSTILPGLADLPIRCLPDVTPAVWVGRHP
jgi:hypothetical protein